MTNDVFNSLKFLFIISQISGTLLFNLKGTVGNRIIQLNNSLLICKVIICILFLWAYMKVIHNLIISGKKLENLPIAFIYINQFITHISIFYSQIKYRMNILEIYRKIYWILITKHIRFCYQQIFYVNFIHITSSVLIITYLYTTYYHNDLFLLTIVIFWELNIITTIGQLYTLFFLIKGIMYEMNSRIKFGNRKNLKEVVDINVVCYEMCKVVNDLYFFMIFNILVLFFGLILTLFTQSINFVIATFIERILWTIYDFCGVILVVSFYEATKYEVS